MTDADGTRTTSPTEPGPSADARGRDLPLLPRWLMVLTVVVVVAGVAVRFTGLARQSYWTDEMFSVQLASRGLLHAVAGSIKEIHPPLYSALLALWVSLGGSSGTVIAWTHLLSALIGAVAVVVAWTSLRRTPISAEGRALAVAAVATSGMAIVYAQDARMYALLLLGAVGLTGAAVRWALMPAGTPRDRLPWPSLLAWGLLASAAHLFGAVLVAALTAVLLVRRRARAELLPLLGAAAVAVSPIVLWVAVGSTRPGFAGQTSWIPAPRLSNLMELLTSVFASGVLVPHADGFPLVSWYGLAVVGLLLVAAGVAGAVLRRRGAADEAVERGARDGSASAFLLAASLLLVVGVLVVSQGVHLWTTRNLIVAVPCLAWGVVLLVVHLAGPARRPAAVVVLVALAASLVTTYVSLQPIYKTDFRGTVAYLAHVRETAPDTTFVVSAAALPREWFLAADTPWPPGTAAHVFSRATFVPRATFLDTVTPVPGPAVYVYYGGVADRSIAKQTQQVLSRVDTAGTCRPVPIPGMVVVSCP